MTRAELEQIAEQLGAATEEAVAQAEAAGREWQSEHLEAFRRGWLTSSGHLPEDKRQALVAGFDDSENEERRLLGVKGESWPRDVVEAYVLGAMANSGGFASALQDFGLNDADDVFAPEGKIAPETPIERKLRHAGANYNANDDEFIVFRGDVVGGSNPPLQDRDEVLDALREGEQVTVIDRTDTTDDSPQWRSDQFLAGVYLGPDLSADADDGWVEIPGTGDEVPTEDFNRHARRALRDGEPVFPEDPGHHELHANARPVGSAEPPADEVVAGHRDRRRDERTDPYARREPRYETEQVQPAETASTSPVPLPVAKPSAEWDPGDHSRPNPNTVWDAVVAGRVDRTTDGRRVVENTGPTFSNMTEEGRQRNRTQERVLRPGNDPAVVVRDTDISVTAGHAPSGDEADTSSNGVNRRYGVGEDDDFRGPVYSVEDLGEAARRVGSFFRNIFR